MHLVSVGIPCLWLDALEAVAVAFTTHSTLSHQGPPACSPQDHVPGSPYKVIRKCRVCAGVFHSVIFEIAGVLWAKVSVSTNLIWLFPQTGEKSKF